MRLGLAYLILWPLRYSQDFLVKNYTHLILGARGEKGSNQKPRRSCKGMSHLFALTTT